MGDRLRFGVLDRPLVLRAAGDLLTRIASKCSAQCLNEGHLAGSHLDYIPFGEKPFVTDRLRIDDCPVATPKIADDPPFGGVSYLGMMAATSFVRHNDLVLGSATDDQGNAGFQAKNIVPPTTKFDD